MQSVDDLNLDTRKLVETHVTESFARISFDDALGRSHPILTGRNSMSAVFHKMTDFSTTRHSSFGCIPGHEVIETSVRFLGVTRTDSHCAFQLHVDTGKKQFEIQKRYSQFRDLRQQLLLSAKAAGAGRETARKDHCHNGACQQLAQQLFALKFPRRKMKLFLHQGDEIKTAIQRQTQLQHFIESLLAVYRTAPKRQVRCCVNSQCRILKVIQSFLDIECSTEDEAHDWSPLNEVTTSCVTTLHETNTRDCSNVSPGGFGKSAMCLEELHTITEDTELFDSVETRDVSTFCSSATSNC
ncbi:hypothetical protein PsorP6_003854 [Peronosclerospora sorghi]|uniref:Uncharacterized protein n=1 Tax=Peronosclerospora sorghi TaxID=230839 RepID=A0ACC0VQ50_9STRA|nr:hypothetical protein PsorP6_003854 [Peronosclerospora sorghi]